MKIYGYNFHVSVAADILQLHSMQIYNPLIYIIPATGEK